ncbi:MAG: alpha/beta hydrolase, partial [Alphaproteobacteria bacterium]|nr:alpha/beta hydrolase [Alphaproteobacteria bacterium]
MSALASACTSAGTFVANSSARIFGDYALHDNLVYGAHDQRLDVYSPKPIPTAAPVVMFFYGGGWNTGNKEMFAFVGDALSARGYVVVIADYRKYPQVTFPAFVQDGAQAVAWTVKNISDYGGSTNNIHLMGHSAGAHLAALLVSDERYLQQAGISPQHIQSFAGLAGPYHFIPEKELYKKVFAPPSNYPNMHVDNFIDGNEPPMLLLAGGEDTTVYYHNIEM